MKAFIVRSPKVVEFIVITNSDENLVEVMDMDVELIDLADRTELRKYCKNKELDDLINTFEDEI